jgi:hypothetical protein
MTDSSERRANRSGRAVGYYTNQRTWTMSKADDFGVPDVDIVAAAEKAGEIGAGGVPAAPCRPVV